MRLKNIMKYMAGDCIINVEDAMDEKFDYVDDFTSNETDKMKLYQDAKVVSIIPYSTTYVQINVNINCE